MLISSTAPIAAERGASMFSFSTYGTFGLIHSSEGQADFVTSILQPTGIGFSHAWSADVEWANIKYELTPEASIRVGRTVLATFSFPILEK